MSKNKSFEDVYRSAPDLVFSTNASRYLVHWLEKYGPAQPRTALDIGCGEGRNSLFLATRGWHVTAIDSSATAIESVRNRAEAGGVAVNALCVDIAEYNWEEGDFGLIVANTILDHLERSKGDRVIERIQATLLSDGLVFAAVFTTNDPGATKSKDASPTAGLVRRYFEPDELRVAFGQLELIKYHVESSLDTSHGPPHYHSVARLLARKSLT